MDWQTTRRAVLGALVGAGVAGGYFSPARSYLDRFAPLSGSVWGAARASRQRTVESPYGPATVRYDEFGVPQISADDETALYFAVGYVQATDRLFQFDLQRRLMSGTLSAVVGDVTLESDRFYRQMAFRDAAEATVEHLRETFVTPLLKAYRDGVNAAMENEPLPLAFRLLEYEPDPWTLTDTALIEKLIAWQLTGRFFVLRRALVREKFGQEMATELYPSRYDHDAPIIRDRHGDLVFGPDESVTDDRSDQREPIEPSLVNWLSQFESDEGIGSNSWVIGPEHADGDGPILSNDPHLSLQAPPTWYEMHLDGPAHRVRGVAFPGAPFVTIGENDHGAWGFTNSYADVIDFYQYDSDGEQYQYGDKRREFETERQEIEVAGGQNERIEIKRSVHGPVIEEAQQTVGVSWVGHAATETTLALYGLTHSEGIDDALSAVKQFESPSQNMVYADRDGNTFYYMTGQIPIRRIDGEPVRGDQIFDGSAREGEWKGFKPFGRPSWEGFVPTSGQPHVINPDYLATANQQIVPDEQLNYYLSEKYVSPYRGERIYELLDERVAAGESIDLAYLKQVGRDSYDGRAAELVDPLLSAARDAEDEFSEAISLLAEWDYHMDADSAAALVFDHWFEAYRSELFDSKFEAEGLDDEYYPAAAALARLPADSDWFGSAGRETVMRRALRTALSKIEENGHEVYGDICHTGQIGHLTELDFLAYPEHPRGGSVNTVWNYGYRSPRGGSWEMQLDFDGDALGLLPGGNSGRYFSPHYDDQIERWANGNYRQLSRELSGELTVEFQEEEG